MSALDQTVVADIEHLPLLTNTNTDDSIRDFENELLEKSSNIQTMFHIICLVAGTGMLQIPFALAKGGWIGTGLLLMGAAVNNYSGCLLAECLYQPEGRLKGYPDIGRVAFGTYGEYLVQIFYNLALLGSNYF
jgi:vesicular inhibitory amino acid transporter